MADILWAPWRLEYILGPKPDECVFCLPAHRREDAERLVLHRGRHCFVIMNKYPYTNGHVMVTPYRHVMTLSDLSPDETHEMMDLMQATVRIMNVHFRPGGINAGLNIGEAAGAGIKEHLHFHLLPRWVGDASFMAAACDTRVIPETLAQTYARLKPLYDRLAAPDTPPHSTEEKCAT
jgi:ATP adenylyltransferase